ncbi:MAG TPA: helix-turn-helix transcriptional regulator [Nitrospinae bacterium]|jgi:transcriptional regulator with XRE-family HTH domain|nr:helix-turn-helix transcriptional regulator [Nitrospinota bacterium]
MSVLAKNLKTIRKELGCTQSVMSEILKVGFRTFVRYEAGERDAPVSVMVKIARLGNISLEQLLTTAIEPNDIAPLEKINRGETVQVESIDFKVGQVNFKDPDCQELMTIDDTEKRILTLFRKMPPRLKKDCMDSIGQIVEAGRVVSRLSDRAGKGEKKVTPKVKIEIKNPWKPITKRKPGRKKLDKKALQEKIDKLKIITRAINKITVR